MRQSANALPDDSRPVCAASERAQRADLGGDRFRMPDPDRLGIMALAMVKLAAGKRMASIWPSSRPAAVISPAVEHPAWRRAGA